ncbi:hypothetical protein [Achromobacter xylosoxidans]|nr:hypothetical protein [Achromobacter xylosoxidans]
MEAHEIVAIVIFGPLLFCVASMFIFGGCLMLRAAYEVFKEGL